MKFNPLSRRHFLEGLSGFTLALPYLPSLLGKAVAQQGAPALGFLAMAQGHGGVYASNFYGPAAMSREGMTLQTLYANQNHVIGRRPIQQLLSTVGNETAISPILGSFLNPLLPKVNLIRGLAIPFYIAHHNGGYLGNNRGHNGGPESPQTSGVTLDWDLAKPGGPIYGSSSPSVRRVNLHAWLSLSYESGEARAPSTVEQTWHDANLNLFNALFSSFGSGPSNGTFLVDRVIEDFQRVTQSAYGWGPKMSAEDMQRMQAHIANLFDLQGRLQATNNCQPTPPSSVWSISSIGYDNYQARMGEMARLFATAFNCGATRVWVQHLDQFTNYAGPDYHQDIAHNATAPAAQAELVQNYRKGAEVFARFLSELEAIPNGFGGTLLDQMAAFYTHESGPQTHDSIEMPLLQAGRAGGAIATGQYLDYRNLNQLFSVYAGQPIVHGIPWNRFLGSMAQSLGLQPSQFHPYPNRAGYGEMLIPPNPWWGDWRPYYDHQRADCDLPLPWLFT